MIVQFPSGKATASRRRAGPSTQDAAILKNFPPIVQKAAMVLQINPGAARLLELMMDDTIADVRYGIDTEE